MLVVNTEWRVSSEYQHPTQFIRFHQSPYAGPPSEMADQAWHDLLNDMAIRVSGDDLKGSNQSSVALPEGGYLAWAGVYHELHCVVCLSSPGSFFVADRLRLLYDTAQKLLRQWNYPEQYRPNMTDREKTDMQGHAGTLLETLLVSGNCG